MRDIVQAMQMVTQSLQLNSQHLPSWHLLALLCTCPIKDYQAQALKTCEVALAEASKITNKDSWVDYSDDILQHVLLQMTETLLVERVHGAEAAMASQEVLFQIFGKIVVPELIPDSTSSNMLHEAISNGNARYGMVLSGSLGNMSVQESANGADGSANSASVSRNRSASSSSLQPRSLGGRSASVSSFTGRKFHLAEMFSNGHLEKSDVSSVRSVPPPATASKSDAGGQSLHRHGSKLSLLDPKSLIRKQKKEETTGLLSLQHTKRKYTANGFVIRQYRSWTIHYIRWRVSILHSQYRSFHHQHAHTAPNYYHALQTNNARQIATSTFLQNAV